MEISVEMVKVPRALAGDESRRKEVSMDLHILSVVIAFCVLLFLVRRRRRSQAQTQTADPTRTQQEGHSGQQRTATEEHRHQGPYPLTFSLAPCVEAFTPEPLPTGQRFLITLTGTCTYGHGIPRDRADACFCTQLSPNFTHRYQGLLFDSCPVTAEPFDEDRAQHHYSFVYLGTGKKLSLLLTPPTWPPGGALAVSIRPLVPEEEALLTAPETARREAAERQAREKEEQQSRERAEKVQTRVMELTHLAEVQSHHADPKHLEDYARKNKETLLRRHDEITKKYLADREVIAHLKEHAPQLVAFATWEMRALTAAEQLDAQQPPAPPPPPPRPKLTPEEREAKVGRWRAVMLEHKRIQAQDHMADVNQKLDLLATFRADLEKRSGLDPEEIEQLVQEFKEKLFTEEDSTNGPGKQI